MALQSTRAATLLGELYVADALPGAQHPPLADMLQDAPPSAQPFRPVVRRLHRDLDLAYIKKVHGKKKILGPFSGRLGCLSARGKGYSELATVNLLLRCKHVAR